MRIPNRGKFVSAVFITFSGNCKAALTYYQTCFGGTLQFEIFEKKIENCTEKPVVIGSLVSDSIVIHGSDLVHNEGRTLGNYLCILLHCKTLDERQELIQKLTYNKRELWHRNNDDQKLVEIIDVFDVRWILGV